MNEKELKELKEINKTLSSIRTFIIAESQLTKNIYVELSKQGRDIQKIKSIMEEKNGSDNWWKITWRRIKRKFN